MSWIWKVMCVCRLPYVWFCAYGVVPWTMLWRMLTSHVGVQVWGLSTKEGGGSPSHTCLHTHTPQDAGAIKLHLKIYHCQCSEVHSAHLRAVQWLLGMFSWFKRIQVFGEKCLIPVWNQTGKTTFPVWNQTGKALFGISKNFYAKSWTLFRISTNFFNKYQAKDPRIPKWRISCV